MRPEDQTRSERQDEGRYVARPGVQGAFLLLVISGFAALYLATFLVAGYGGARVGFRLHYWSGLISAACATFLAVRLFEKGRWPIGFFVAPRFAFPEALAGIAFGGLLVAGGDLLVLATTSLRHAGGSGFPWRDLLLVYIPASVHEEVLFRGYLFQRVRLWHRGAAIAGSALVFAILHSGNSGVSVMALVNILGGGVLLALAWERYQRLWFPIGLHLGWNVVSGAVLGYDVSGYVGSASLLRFAGKGPEILTGGPFGIEGSVWALAVEAAGVAILLRRERTHRL